MRQTSDAIGASLAGTLGVALLAAAPGAQLRLHDPTTLLDASAAPPTWKLVSVPVTGAEFYVPSGFRQLRPKHYYRRTAFQGRLGGAYVKLFLNEVPGKFQTVSRVLLALSARSTLQEVYAFRLDGEPAAFVRRKTKGPDDPARTILELVVCPRRRGVSLELQYLTDPGPQAFSEGQRLLSFLRPIPTSGLTVAIRGPEAQRREEIELGFDATVWDKVKVEKSAHYRLYTIAASGKKLLEFLERELIDKRLYNYIGRVPPRFEQGRLPIFLHLTKPEYQLAALGQGIPREQVEAMQGYAWDRYYTTWYQSPRRPIHIHEGTHQYVTAILGLDGGGPWLQEGLARLIEADYDRRQPERVARNLLKSRKEGFLKLGDLLSATTFLAASSHDGLKSSERYDIAAAFLIYLAHEHHNDFRDLLLQAGVLPPGNADLLEAAFRRSIRMDLDALEKDWHAWLLEGS